PLLSLIPLFLPLLPPPPLFLLFPYTTLFRSFHKTISKIAGYHQLFKLAGSGSWYPQFPYGQFYYFCLFTVIDRHHCFFFICKPRSEEHTSELQSRFYLVCRHLLQKKKKLHMT